MATNLAGDVAKVVRNAFIQKRRESKERLRWELKQLREQVSVRDRVLQAIASSSNSRHLIEMLQSKKPIESVCGSITASRVETSASIQISESNSTCSVEQVYAEHKGLGNPQLHRGHMAEQDFVGTTTSTPPHVNSDVESEPDTISSSYPTTPTDSIPTSAGSNMPPIMENTGQNTFGQSQKLAFKLPAVQSMQQFAVASNWMPGCWQHYDTFQCIFCL